MASVSSNFAWTMESQPELNHPALKSPIPCKWGSSCYYNGCCCFVHPGEEGTGRKLFPSRVSFNQQYGLMLWEAPVVRLIGNASFYERRRKGMSWSQWVDYKNQKQKQKQKQMAYLPYELDAVFPAQDEKDKMRRKLFPMIYQVLVENKYTILECGMVHRDMSAGKIVEKMLQMKKLDEIEKILDNERMMGNAIFYAYEYVLEDLKNNDKRYPNVN